jgi:hypothetical protein
VSDLGCESPLATLRPGDVLEPFVYFWAGDCDRLEASLSRRIVPSDLRLLLGMWREDRPLECSVSELSEPWVLSEILRLRLAAVSGTAEGAVVALEAAAGAGWSEVEEEAGCCVCVYCVVDWAENCGEEEAGGFGMAGWAEVTGDGGMGGVSSARTNAWAGTRTHVMRVVGDWTGCPAWDGPGLRWTHGKTTKEESVVGSCSRGPVSVV